MCKDKEIRAKTVLAILLSSDIGASQQAVALSKHAATREPSSNVRKLYSVQRNAVHEHVRRSGHNHVEMLLKEGRRESEHKASVLISTS